MNLQHAVQHSLNDSLVWLHTNRPAGTRGLTRIWLISISSLPVQSEPRAKSVYLHLLTLEMHWRRLGVLVLKLASAIQTTE